MKLALIGAPNVGKSTLFNKLVGRRIAITHDVAGMTRDRLEHRASFRDIDFSIIDTAGVTTRPENDIALEMNNQSYNAIKSSDAILFVVDNNFVVNVEIAEFIRGVFKKLGQKPVILLANKCDSYKNQFIDHDKLGFGKPILVSGEHNIGFEKLYVALKGLEAGFHEQNPLVSKQVLEKLDAEQSPESQTNNAPITRPIKLAFIGRPNAGKSTILNALIGEKRLITSNEAGTTRDAISIPWHHRGTDFILIDTAGQRKRTKVKDNQEFLSVNSANRAIKSSDVAILIVDATAPLERQDLNVAKLAGDIYKPIVIALNKWDLIKDKKAVLDEVKYQLGHCMSQIGGVSFLPVSGVKNLNLTKIIDASITAYNTSNIKIETSKLNRWLRCAIEEKAIPVCNGMEVKVKYMTQTGTSPLKFVLFCNVSRLIQSYERYLLNSLRKNFGLLGVPIVLECKKSDNPYGERRR